MFTWTKGDGDMDLFEGLSPDQRAAVSTIDEDLEIIACAGAGKTGVVTRRIINILKSNPNIQPENVVAFTFTKKGSGGIEKSYQQIWKVSFGTYKRLRSYVCWYNSWILYLYVTETYSRISDFLSYG